jgi:hypothetical protein
MAVEKTEKATRKQPSKNVKEIKFKWLEDAKKEHAKKQQSGKQ